MGGWGGNKCAKMQRDRNNNWEMWGVRSAGLALAQQRWSVWSSEGSGCCPGNANASLKTFSGRPARTLSSSSDGGGGQPTCTRSVRATATVLTAAVAFVVAQRTVSGEVAQPAERDGGALVAVVAAPQGDVGPSRGHWTEEERKKEKGKKEGS